MISKLIVWGRNRPEAIERMRRALYEYIIVGVKTNIPFHKAVMNNLIFQKGELSTHFIEEQKNLYQEMQRIIEEERSLEEKLSSIFRQNKKIAAISATIDAYLLLSKEGKN
jgi:pyruvate carboxylase subunit A